MLGRSLPVVQALAVLDDRIYVAGNLRRVGEVEVRGLAVAWFDGRRWRPLLEGLTGPNAHVVEDLAVTPGALWFTGTFTRAGVNWSAQIARWDGPLPRDADPALELRYDPPPPLHVLVRGHHPDSPYGRQRLRADGPFGNGAFSHWTEGYPDRWSYIQDSRQAPPDTLPPEPLPDGGVRLRGLAGARPRLHQRFSVTGGATYRVRVTGRIVVPPTSNPPPYASIQFGDYSASGGLLNGCGAQSVRDTRWTTWEILRRVDPRAAIATLSIAVIGDVGTVDIRSVAVDTIAFDGDALIDTVATILSSRLAANWVDFFDWAQWSDDHKPFGTAAATPADLAAELSVVVAGLPCCGLALRSSGGCVERINRLACDGEVSSEAGRSTRDEIAAKRAFPGQGPQGRAFDRDGIYYLAPRDGRISYLPVTEATGLVLDLRRTSRSNLVRSDRFHWDLTRALGPLTGVDIPYGQLSQRLDGRTLQRPLVIRAGDGEAAGVPVVVLVDGSTSGLHCTLALACSALPGATLVGQPAGPAAWIEAQVPLIIGRTLQFPDTQVTDLVGARIGIDRGLTPDVLVDDFTGIGDGLDPILDAGLSIIRGRLADAGQP